MSEGTHFRCALCQRAFLKDPGAMDEAVQRYGPQILEVPESELVSLCDECDAKMYARMVAEFGPPPWPTEPPDTEQHG